MKNTIKKLSSLLDSGKKGSKLKSYKEVLGENIEETIEEESFFQLPTKEILDVVSMSNTRDIDLIREIVSQMNKTKSEETILLLNVINSDEFSFEETMDVISMFSESPVCRKAGELFNEFKEKLVQKKEDEIKELKSEIEELNKPHVDSPITEKPDDFESDIHEAAKSGKLTSIKYLVEVNNEDPGAKDFQGRTPMIYAAEQGHIDIVKYLNEKCKVNPEEIDNSSRTPLIYAAKYGRIDVVKYLCDVCHVDVESKDKNMYTALNWAACNDHLDVVKYLFEVCKADFESFDVYGRTPFNNAAFYNSLNVIKYLFETCKANTETKDSSGLTPIINAARKGYLEMVKYLNETCHVTLDEYEISENQELYVETYSYLKECLANDDE